MKIFIKGFLFGLLLQFAVGPVCFYILNLSIVNGLLMGFIAVITAAFVDMIFIILAVCGVSKVINKHEKLLKILGFIILFLFGIKIIISSFLSGSTLSFQIYKVSFFTVILKTFIVTVSNPLTIVFWTGVFASKAINEKYNIISLFKFGSGAVFSTLIFMSAVILAGNYIIHLFGLKHIFIINIIIGLILIYYGFSLLLKKNKN